MATGKFVPGSRFEIDLKCMRLFERLKGDISFKLPGRILSRSLASVPAIMRGKATLQVRGRTDIALIGMANGTEDVGVVHKMSIAQNHMRHKGKVCFRTISFVSGVPSYAASPTTEDLLRSVILRLDEE